MGPFGRLRWLKAKSFLPQSWFGVAWAVLCGLIASGRLAPKPEALVRAGLALLLAGPVFVFWRSIRLRRFSSRASRLLLSMVLALAGYLAALLGYFLGWEICLLVVIGLLALLVLARRWGTAALAFQSGIAWLVGYLALGGAEWTIPAKRHWREALAIVLPNLGLALWKPLAFAGLYALLVYEHTALRKGEPARSTARLNLAQAALGGALLLWGHPLAASGVGVLLLVQVALQAAKANPRPWIEYLLMAATLLTALSFSR